MTSPIAAANDEPLPAQGQPVISVQEVSEVEFPVIGETGGELAVYQPPDDDAFAIRRVFCVKAAEGAARGRHAHRRCTQLLVALSGRVRVVVSDGSETRDFLLGEMGKGLLIPPTIWAEQIYQSPDAVLMVLCDRPYEADDYIRDYVAFLAYRRDGAAEAIEAVA